MPITAPELLCTPNGYPESWRRVFEALVAPIILVRKIVECAADNSFRDRAAGKKTGLWLSPDEFNSFRDEALTVRQRVRETLRTINGVAERTWRAGSAIRRETHFVLFPLTDELGKDYPEPVLESVRKGIIEKAAEIHEIPLLKKLRKAIAAEKSVNLADELSESRPPTASEPLPIHSTARRTPRKASVNARFIDLLSKTPEAAGWTAAEVARAIHCSASSVVGTNTWKSMKLDRAKGRAERASQKAAAKRKK